MYFHSHSSDDSAHNFAATFEHMNKLIHWVYERIVFMKYVIIYDTTDGFIKQYICANSMWLLSVLSFTHKFIIYRFKNAPGSVRSKICGINGSNKTYLEQNNMHDRLWRIK